MHKKILLALLTVAALGLTVPTMASAATTNTPIPDLGPNDDQAYLADGDGNPEHATMTLSGTLSGNSSTGLATTCNYNGTITALEDGTSEVTAWTASNCTTNVPGCTLSTVATNLPWGNRLVFDTGSSVYRDRINAAFDVTLGAGCPVTGTFPLSGLISPTIAVSGGVLTATFSGASTGTFSGAVGPVTWTGTLTSTSGIGADTQLIF